MDIVFSSTNNIYSKNMGTLFLHEFRFRNSSQMLDCNVIEFVDQFVSLASPGSIKIMSSVHARCIKVGGKTDAEIR